MLDIPWKVCDYKGSLLRCQSVFLRKEFIQQLLPHRAKNGFQQSVSEHQHRFIARQALTDRWHVTVTKPPRNLLPQVYIYVSEIFQNVAPLLLLIYIS